MPLPRRWRLISKNGPSIQYSIVGRGWPTCGYVGRVRSIATFTSIRDKHVRCPSLYNQNRSSAQFDHNPLKQTYTAMTFNKATALALFGLLALIGARADGLSADQREFNPPFTPIPGVTINNDEVGRYCILGQRDPPKGYACFSLLGNIRARMFEHQNLTGFMTEAGEGKHDSDLNVSTRVSRCADDKLLGLCDGAAFVLIDNGGTQSFATDVDHVTVTPSKQAHCLRLTVERQKAPGYQEARMTSTSCPASPAFHLADKWTDP